jgi:hypothetical protein
VPDYHGPGRGAGNAISVLLDAWLASGRNSYIDFAEVLINRTVHPEDALADRDLNNFELRWSYTVYLQQLARYLLLTEGVDRPGAMRDYVAASLAHYADWIVDHELFSLDYPERLEFPTETWAAQELRKGNVLLAAAQFVDANRASQYRQRGQAILTRAWQKLMSFESRSYTRPQAIGLQQGYIEKHFSAVPPRLPRSLRPGLLFKGPIAFQPQRATIRAGLRSPLSIARMSIHAICRARWWRILRRDWRIELARRLASRFR